MFRFVAVAALCFVAASAAPLEGAEEARALFTQLRTLDQATKDAIQAIMKNGHTSKNEKIEAIKGVVANIQDPAQKAAAEKAQSFFLAQEGAIKTKITEVVAKLSVPAQSVANNILAQLDDATSPTKTVMENVKNAFKNAPAEVQNELKAVAEQFKNVIQKANA